MEYLQQGLERFKREQGSEEPPQRRQTGAPRPVPPPIVYTSTKTVELTDETMRTQRLISGFEGGAFVDAFKMLRTQVVKQCRQNGWNVLGVTSPTPHEGKTLTAVNLSLALAMDLAHTVLLVDADMHRPAVHEAFGMDSCPGLTEHLFDEVPLEQLLIHPGIGRFVFLPGGRPPAEGETFRNLALARTLALLADGGEDAFYRGEPAEEIVRFSRSVGGALDEADFAEHASTWVSPLSTTFMDCEVWELPPATQGIAALEMLSIAEARGIADLRRDSADWWHVMVEAKKLAFEDRARWIGDTR